MFTVRVTEEIEFKILPGSQSLHEQGGEIAPNIL